MIIYNVTIKVDALIADEWLVWLRGEHITEVLETGCFIDARVLRLKDIDDSEGPTYAIQYTAKNRSLYDQYIHMHASLMRQKSFDKWGDRFIAFRSVMEVVN